MSNFEENIFGLFDNKSEYENEHSITNESSNLFDLSLFQSGIIDNTSSFNDFQLPIPDIMPILNVENNNKDTSSQSNNSQNLLSKKTGRGRQRSTINNENMKVHDKFSTDNLLRKIQVHYISFIVSFLNEILAQLNFKQQFLKLDYVFKKNVNLKFVESLKKKNLGEIICNKISSKYKKDKNANYTIYEEVKKNEVLNNILSENYLRFFKNIYYKNNKNINLKEYGLDKDITLSKKVKLFEDLLKEKNASDFDKEYQAKINECAIQNYCQVQFIKK